MLRCEREAYDQCHYLAWWPSTRAIGARLAHALDEERRQNHALLTNALILMNDRVLSDVSLLVGHPEARRALLEASGADSLAELGHWRLIPPRDLTYPLATTSVAEERLSPHLFIINCWY